MSDKGKSSVTELLPSAIDSPKAANAFGSQREALKLVLQHDLSSVADNLYTKSIISRHTLTKATNQFLEPIDRTVSLLNEVEDKIRAEPHVFTKFVRILDSEPTLRSQAKELVEKYLKGSYTHPETPTHSATSSTISRYAW